MASATPDDVKRLAALARIAIPEDKLATFAAEFESVLAYVGTLDSLTLASEEGEVYPTRRNVLREDGEPTPAGTYTDAIAAQFPEREGNHLVVKQIISHD